jgi:hypothetical protein
MYSTLLWLNFFSFRVMWRLNIDDGVPGLTKKAMALRASKLDFCSDVLRQIS